jgi:membrane carboxypeptidase/penicillin-binding protein
VRRNVLHYDQRHGYRGPEARIELPADADANATTRSRTRCKGAPPSDRW